MPTPYEIVMAEWVRLREDRREAYEEPDNEGLVCVFRDGFCEGFKCAIRAIAAAADSEDHMDMELKEMLEACNLIAEEEE